MRRWRDVEPTSQQLPQLKKRVSIQVGSSLPTRTHFWLWPNLLSLDAPAVALLWQVFFVRCFHASVGAESAVLLGVAVWLIYAADRMLDAWRGAGKSARHEFYRRHWRAVVPVWIALL